MLKIHYITPFATDKNIGREYNERIAELPEDSWIVIRDGDSLFMRPDWGKQVEDIIRFNGDKFKLIGCITNRLRATHQLHENRFSEEGDISKHRDIADYRYGFYYADVEATTTIAGLCMIFHKSTWQEVGGFEENSLKFDSQFCNAIRRKYGISIGIAKGLYLFHLYRWGQKNPTEYIQHLVHES